MLAVEEDQMCMCGTGCSARYRCLLITVIYQDRDKLYHNATLFENESTLGRKVDIILNLNWSLTIKGPVTLGLRLVADHIRPKKLATTKVHQRPSAKKR